MTLIASSGGDLRCPTCGYVFHHNTKKWFVALPAVIIVAAVALYLGRGVLSPLIGALISVGLVALVILAMPSYVIIVPPYREKA